MPFKFRSKGGHHIPCQRHRVTNWRDYDTALRNRGSHYLVYAQSDRRLKGASSDDAWRTEALFDLPIETALTLRAVFRLALRQSEGLIGSIMQTVALHLNAKIRNDIFQ